MPYRIDTNSNTILLTGFSNDLSVVSNQNITKVTLAAPQFTQEEFGLTLTQIFSIENSTVTSLRVNGGNPSISHLIETLKLSSTISSLELYRVNIGTIGAILLANAIQVNSSITNLFVWECSIASSLEFDSKGKDGIYALADALKVNNTIKIIDLSWNNLGDEGACYLANSLIANNSLRGLVIESNGIDNLGAAAIASALLVNASLEALYLGNNNIGPIGAGAIADSLKTNTALKSLYLGNTHIGANGAKKIGEALKINTTLVLLNLGDNRVETEGVIALAEGMRKNTTLECFTMSQMVCNSDKNQIIAAALHDNYTINSLAFQIPFDRAFAEQTAKRCEANRKTIWKFDELDLDLQCEEFLVMISHAAPITRAIAGNVITAEQMHEAIYKTVIFGEKISLIKDIDLQQIFDALILQNPELIQRIIKSGTHKLFGFNPDQYFQIDELILEQHFELSYVMLEDKSQRDYDKLFKALTLARNLSNDPINQQFLDGICKKVISSLDKNNPEYTKLALAPKNLKLVQLLADSDFALSDDSIRQIKHLKDNSFELGNELRAIYNHWLEEHNLPSIDPDTHTNVWEMYQNLLGFQAIGFGQDNIV